jgi:hypothetical protein
MPEDGRGFPGSVNQRLPSCAGFASRLKVNHYTQQIDRREEFLVHARPRPAPLPRLRLRNILEALDLINPVFLNSPSMLARR